MNICGTGFSLGFDVFQSCRLRGGFGCMLLFTLAPGSGLLKGSWKDDRFQQNLGHDWLREKSHITKSIYLEFFFWFGDPKLNI